MLRICCGYFAVTYTRSLNSSCESAGSGCEPWRFMMLIWSVTYCMVCVQMSSSMGKACFTPTNEKRFLGFVTRLFSFFNILFLHQFRKSVADQRFHFFVAHLGLFGCRIGKPTVHLRMRRVLRHGINQTLIVYHNELIFWLFSG